MQNSITDQPNLPFPSRVFVIQQTDLNLAKATRFGELFPLIPGRVNITMQPQPVIRELRRKLADFSDNDYILPVGDPIAIGLALMVAMDNNNGKVRVLKWDKTLSDYYVVNVNFYDKN